MSNTEKISKFLCYVLRHKPEEIGIELDLQGWTNIGVLIKRSAANGKKFDRDTLLEIVRTCEKQRFTISEDGTRIRAAQGHSIKVDLALAPSDPPALLYHGTATRFLDSIMEHGIRAGDRHMVHLSKDWQTAIKVGKRHGSPIVITLNVQAMLDEGLDFFEADNGVWMVEHVWPRFFKAMASDDVNLLTDKFA